MVIVDMDEVFVKEVRIVRNSEKKEWFIWMNKDRLLVEAIAEPKEVSVFQSFIFSFKKVGQNQVAHVTGPREKADEESLRFFVEKMVEIQGDVPADMQGGLYTSLWKIIEPFYPLT